MKLLSDIFKLSVLFIGFSIPLSGYGATLETQPTEHGPNNRTFIADNQDVATLEESGFGIHVFFAGKSPSAADLFQTSTSYKMMTETLTKDIDDERAANQRLPLASANGAEFFSISWLKSRNVKFQLVGVVPRFDRRLQADMPCGEIRFIYRPYYSSTLPDPDRVSQLPFTIMAVASTHRLFRNSSCEQLLARNIFSSREILLKELLSLTKEASFSWNQLVSRIEINMQIGRWPTSSNDQFSEQSHYLLRVFSISNNGKSVTPEYLENSLDTDALRQSPALFEKLQSWLKSPSTLTAIDAGDAVVPEEFLSKKAISVAPFGYLRFANFPFSSVLSADDVLTEARIHRLDMLSCVGCHQSQSIAGFHFLGAPPAGVSKFLTLKSPASTYFQGIQIWRDEDIKSFKAMLPRTPMPVADRIGNGGIGDTCENPSSGDQKDMSHGCKSGLTCDLTHSGDISKKIGLCVETKMSVVGTPCDHAKLVSHKWSSLAPLDDLSLEAQHDSCGAEGICAYSRAGFPAGFCLQACTKGSENLCIGVPSLGPFTNCVNETGRYKDCAAKHYRVVEMPRCASTADCRRDYACISASDTDSFCAPPYFLPDLTLGHHPKLKE